MNTSTPSARLQRQRDKQAALDRTNEALVVRNLMSTPVGRRWMWLLLGRGQVFADDGDLDPQHLAWKEGRRTMGLYLLTVCTTHCPASYIAMTEEATGVTLTLLEEPKEETDDA